MHWSRTSARLLVVTVLTLVGAGCTYAPPPPLVSSTPTTTAPAKPTPTQAVFGIDVLAGGVNPHAVSDQSTVTTALSSVVLPSVFRTGPDGKPQLDPNLMRSAEVTSQQPFTVTYELRSDASWSDGAPIAAEDFSYLADQMRTQPGTVNPSGYRLIANVASRSGGKHVEVTFAKPYPGWRTLFDNLLPAHLLRAAPGGWSTALADSFPASGGPFTIRTLDRDRGEVVLERNDRYWEKPALLDQIVLRKADSSGLTDALASGADQAALLRADSIALRELRGLGTLATQTTVPRAAIAQVLLRAGSSALADVRVRTAVADALDRDSLIATGTGAGPSAQLRADDLVRAPTQPGYHPEIPPGAPGMRPDPAATQALLTSAGYVRRPSGWTKDGQPVSLVIAAPAGIDPYQSLAARVKAQLADAGLPATVITPPAAQLYSALLAPTTTPTKPTATPPPEVDIVVGPRIVTGDPAADLAATYGCPPPDATTVLPPNPAGLCDPAVQPVIDGALTGTVPVDQALRTVEPALWGQAVAIPLFQLADTLVTRPELTGITPGPPLTTPFTTAAAWNHVKR